MTTAGDCIDRKVAITKALKKSAKKITWKKVFRNMYAEGK